MGLRRTSNPAAEPISVAEAKERIGLASGDTTHNSQVSALIAGVRAQFERYTRRALITQTWKLTMDCFHCRCIYIPRPPLVSITSITYYDSNGTLQTLSSSKYQVNTESNPGSVEPEVNETWPVTQPLKKNAVAITYQAGFGADSSFVPPDYREVMMQMITFQFFRKGDLDGDYPAHTKWALEGMRAGTVGAFFNVTGEAD